MSDRRVPFVFSVPDLRCNESLSDDEDGEPPSHPACQPLLLSEIEDGLTHGTSSASPSPDRCPDILRPLSPLFAEEAAHIPPPCMLSELSRDGAGEIDAFFTSADSVSPFLPVFVDGGAHSERPCEEAWVSSHVDAHTVFFLPFHESLLPAMNQTFEPPRQLPSPTPTYSSTHRPCTLLHYAPAAISNDADCAAASEFMAFAVRTFTHMEIPPGTCSCTTPTLISVLKAHHVLGTHPSLVEEFTVSKILAELLVISTNAGADNDLSSISFLFPYCLAKIFEGRSELAVANVVGAVLIARKIDPPYWYRGRPKYATFLARFVKHHLTRPVTDPVYQVSHAIRIFFDQNSKTY